MISTMQILPTNFDIYLSVIAILVMIECIIYGFVKGNASLSILIACIVLFIIQLMDRQISGTYLFPIANRWIKLSMTEAILSCPPWAAGFFKYSPILRLAGSFAPLTSMFLHANTFHIFFNMLFLCFVGMPLEQRIGSKNFMIIYVLSGLIGSFAQYSIGSPGIGASGAVLGILGAFAYLYPHEKFTVFLLFIPLRNVPIMFIAAFYLAMDLIFQMSGTMSGIGHLAHIGGIVGGFLIAALMKRRGSVRVYSTSTGGTKININKKKLNVYELYNILRNKEKIELALNEDIPEVQRAIVENIIEEGRCPRCGEKLKIKGSRVECTGCDYCFNLLVNR